jgi:hypothetical protein
VHGRPRLSAARPLALTALLGLTLAGCSHGAQAVHARLPVNASAPACVSAAARLPDRLLGQTRRTTSPSSPALAAWGDPAIILRCGVQSPGASTDHCETVNGIDWVVQSLSDGEEFTTFGRTPAIQVLVPKHYAPEEFALTGLAPAAQTIAQGSQHCS